MCDYHSYEIIEVIKKSKGHNIEVYKCRYCKKTYYDAGGHVKPVCMYSKHGRYMRTFIKMLDAVNYCKRHNHLAAYSNISWACRHKGTIAYGHKWSFQVSAA
jgi:hypothetical protein